MASTATFLEATAARRSVYQLNKSSPIPDSRIIEITKHAARHVPSAFDSQTTRIVLLLGTEHDAFWDIVWEKVSPHAANEDARKASKGRIDGFRGAKGTVLFFESSAARKAKEATLPPLWAERLPGWAEHTSAMHQYFMWTALNAEGLGANLQHYNPMVDEAVIERWNLDKSYELKGQLVFGGLPEGKSVAELAREKPTKQREEYVTVFGA